MLVDGYLVDAHWPAARLVVELQSYEHHAHRQAFDRDYAKLGRLTLAGYQVLPLTDRQLKQETDWVVASLRALLGAARAVPFRPRLSRLSRLCLSSISCCRARPGPERGLRASGSRRTFACPTGRRGTSFARAVRNGTELGAEAKEYMDRGDLVPDEVMVGLIAERVSSEEASDGFILDGFPRTIGQGEALDAKLTELDRLLTAVILIEVPDEEVVRRLSGRRVCVKEGHIFHMEFDPPKNEGVCDIGRLAARDPRRRQARRDPAPAGHLPREDGAARRLLRGALGPAEG